MDPVPQTDLTGDPAAASFRLTSHRRGSPREWVIFTVWLGLLYLIAWQGSHSAAGIVGATIIGLLPIVLSLRTVVELRVLESGGLEVVRTVGVTRIAAHDLWTIEGYQRWNYEGEGVWMMRLRHRGGRISVVQLEGATAFLAAVRAVNPRVAITGLWPPTAP
jgi:hypothetical protein